MTFTDEILNGILQFLSSDNAPGRVLLSTRWKVAVTCRYVIINRQVPKCLNCQSNVSEIERPLVNILYNEGEVKHHIWAVFHLVYRVSKGSRFWAIYGY